MPAPRYADAARRKMPTQQKEPVAPGQGSIGRSHTHSNSGQKHNPLPHDPRFVFTFAAAMGRRVTVQVKSGLQFEGTLHTQVLGSKNIHVTLKNARKLNPNSPADCEEIETLVIPSQEFVQMQACGVPFPQSDSENRNGIRSASTKNEEDSKTGSEVTDERLDYDVLPVRDENDMTGFMGDIERAQRVEKTHIAEKKLVAWDGGQNAGEEIELKGDAGEWCQFADKANKNVTSTFDMDQYTSKLDISKSKYSEAEAERIAREIESEQRERPIHILDDSGEVDEQPEFIRDTTPKSKPMSWADAVKRKTPQPSPEQRSPKQFHSDFVRNQTQVPKNVDPNPIWDQPPVQQNLDSIQPDSPQLIYRPLGRETRSTSEKQEAHPSDFDVGSEAVNTPAETAQLSSYVHGQQDAPVFGSGGYPIEGGIESYTATQDVEFHKGISDSHPLESMAVPYYADPVWGMNPSEPRVLKQQIVDTKRMSVDENYVEADIDDNELPPSAPRAEKKATSTVVPGISFRDKLKANLPSKSSKPVTSVRNAVSKDVGQTHTKSRSNVIDSTDVDVQPSMGRSYSGKLISNPKRNQLHAGDAGRGLPSEEHLLSPMTATHPGMYPPPTSRDVTDSVGMMPPMIHTGYSGMPRDEMSYYGYGPSMEVTNTVLPPGIPVMNPAYPDIHHSSYLQVSEPRKETEGDEGRSGRRFQLNPMAKAFKPVSSLDEPPPQETYPHGSYASVPPVEYSTPKMVPREIPPIMQPPPAAMPPPPKHQSLPQEQQPPMEYNGNPHPHPHGPRPPFMTPSNVITPWPSFPGTGVWHSGLGTPRPGSHQANAMMNGFLPPGMPHYPMFVPGMPPQYMPGMQDPMWRPHHVPPTGMADQQSIAMMWTSYYNQVVPPDKRMWNSSKIPVNSPMVRPNRGNRKPPNGSHAPQQNLQIQPQATHPSGEMP